MCSVYEHHSASQSSTLSTHVKHNNALAVSAQVRESNSMLRPACIAAFVAHFTATTLTGHNCDCDDVIQVLNYLAGGREVGNLVTIACQSVLARPASAASKKLAYDIAKTAALSSDDWDAACEGLRADVAGSHSPEVYAPPACTCSHFISPLYPA